MLEAPNIVAPSLGTDVICSRCSPWEES